MQERYRRYLAFLERHRAYVLAEAAQLAITDRGLRHDLSKYEPDEFSAYADYFYGGHDSAHVPPDVQAAFDHAWLLHQKRNDHHWQYWVLREDSGATKTLPMPELALRELLADWIGAGQAIFGDQADTAAWYARNRDLILLHPDSRAWIEAHLPAPTPSAQPADPPQPPGTAAAATHRPYGTHLSTRP